MSERARKKSVYKRENEWVRERERERERARKKSVYKRENEWVRERVNQSVGQ